jgi:hypothetical protein
MLVIIFLNSTHVQNEVLQAQSGRKRIIPCIHRRVIRSDMKWGLNKIQGVEFDDRFELARNLYSKILRTQPPTTEPLATTSSTEPPPTTSSTLVKIEKDRTKMEADKLKRYYYAAAIVTGLAGILYLFIFALELRANYYAFWSSVIPPALFQLFWVIPMIRHWGEPWYYFGLGGTAVLVIYLYIRLGYVDPTAFMVTLPQYAFIALTAFIIITNKKSKKALVDEFSSPD